MSAAISVFGAESTGSDVIKGRDLSGKLVVITGGGGGLGKETARVLMSAGADLIIGGRASTKLDHARDELAVAYPQSTIDRFALDLADLSSVEQFAAAILDLDRRIDIFIANAGIMACPLARNSAGIELQLATNFIGHALLTTRLATVLRKARQARVVILSSSAHHFSPVVAEDLNFANRPYDKWIAYGQSKTACSLLALKTQMALEADGITALAVHPGVIGTDLMRHLTAEDYAALRTRTDMRPPADMKRKTMEQGAATSIWAATAPELEGRFSYLEDCHVAERIKTPNTAFGVMPYAVDPQAVERLWFATEALIGRALSF
jgi:NAD(P)-dependent dehydrogenase (short-subunit alcohol dehydrogenase family)